MFSLALHSLPIAAVGFLLGAVAASCDGNHGAKCAYRCEARADATTG